VIAVTDEALARGRAAFRDRAWDECRSALRAADADTRLGGDDLVLLSLSSYLSGHDQDGLDALLRAHHWFQDAGRPREAARSAFWLAFMMLGRGELAQGSGWASRSRRLVEEHRLGGADEGYLVSLEARRLLDAGRPDEALKLAEQALDLGDAAGEPDLRALAMLAAGRALVGLGRTPEALSRMDEVMVAAAGDELSPVVTGLAYCMVIGACLDVLDLGRAREWTTALTAWCEGQPGLVPYRGQCLVHRAQIMMLQGAWSDALDEAASACEFLRDPFLADAYYLLGELHRVRGENDAAEAAYRRANSGGRRPEPGLVRLRMAQGRLAAAATTVRRLLGEERDGPVRAEVLAACVDVMVEAGDLPLARDACEELTTLVAASDSPLLRALTARATGTVLLAEGRPEEALRVLRRGWRTWQDLDLPYDAALTRVLIGRCLRALGDEDSAQMELDSARWAFDRLGAAPDLAAVDALAGAASHAAGGLTRRELDVVRLVAAGLTNRAVAQRLFLSEKTVARHLSNIYAKLDLPSRAAATAYAYDHGLV
jgi:DNA-binding NarL/FixJ family response regulator